MITSPTRTVIVANSGLTAAVGRDRGDGVLSVLVIAAVKGRLRSTELIYCWDPDGPADPRGLARADHCDHIHVGFDG